MYRTKPVQIGASSGRGETKVMYGGERWEQTNGKAAWSPDLVSVVTVAVGCNVNVDPVNQFHSVRRP